MTGKRFTIEPTMINECIVDNTTGEQLDTFDYTERSCEVLNELHEDNQKKDKVITHLMKIIYSHEPHIFAKAVEKNVKEMLE